MAVAKAPSYSNVDPEFDLKIDLEIDLEIDNTRSPPTGTPNITHGRLRLELLVKGLARVESHAASNLASLVRPCASSQGDIPLYSASSPVFLL